MESAIQKLAHMSVKDKKSPIRAKQYIFNPTASLSIPLFSYNIQEYAFRQPGYLPINARGLFVRKDNGKIVVRGYDKFFNIGEVEQTKWPFLESMTTGPYELTLKENGCIIFVASIDGHVLVTSKHAFGPRDDASKKPAHSEKGEEWLDRHLQGVSNRKELSAFLEQNDVTAVFEVDILPCSSPLQFSWQMTISKSMYSNIRQIRGDCTAMGSITIHPPNLKRNLDFPL